MKTAGRAISTGRSMCGNVRQLQVALTIDIADTFIEPLDMLMPDILLESPIPILDMLVSFIPDMLPFVTSPVNVTVCPT